jgi:hypothetical protein
MAAILKILVALILSCIGSFVLFIGAGMAGGACHCMKPMFTLFPYGSFAMMHFSSDTFGLPLALLQFPVYVLAVTLVKGARWKLGVVLLVVLLHVAAVSFALTDFCRSRPTCLLWRDPTNRGTRARQNSNFKIRISNLIAPPRQLRRYASIHPNEDVFYHRTSPSFWPHVCCSTKRRAWLGKLPLGNV